MFETPKYWAGTQESFDYVVEAAAKADQMMQARAGSRDPFELPPMHEIKDGVAMVSIQGPLITGSAGFMRLFGITGYDDIAEAVLASATSKDAKAIVLNINSGGGSVNGCDECSEFISSIGRLKPVVTYAGGSMASAAYWLGSSAQKRYASRTSVVGSLGVITTHLDRSKQLEKDGIKATVIRVGQYKALFNPLEPLTEEAKAQAFDMMSAVNDIFEERVAVNLGTTKARVHDKMGQGREFVGAQAQTIGLVDGIATLQEVFSVAKALGRG